MRLADPEKASIQVFRILEDQLNFLRKKQNEALWKALGIGLICWALGTVLPEE